MKLREADCISRPNPKIFFGRCDYLVSPVISGANPQPKTTRSNGAYNNDYRGRRALASYSGKVKNDLCNLDNWICRLREQQGNNVYSDDT